MKCKVIAHRSRPRLEAMLAAGQARFDESARQFYDTNGWVADEQTFLFDGDLQADSIGVAFAGDYAFVRTTKGTWRYLAPTSADDEEFDSIQILPEIA